MVGAKLAKQPSASQASAPTWVSMPMTVERCRRGMAVQNVHWHVVDNFVPAFKRSAVGFTIDSVEFHGPNSLLSWLIQCNCNRAYGRSLSLSAHTGSAATLGSVWEGGAYSNPGLLCCITVKWSEVSRFVQPSSHSHSMGLALRSGAGAWHWSWGRAIPWLLCALSWRARRGFRSS